MQTTHKKRTSVNGRKMGAFGPQDTEVRIFPAFFGPTGGEAAAKARSASAEGL